MRRKYRLNRVDFSVLRQHRQNAPAIDVQHLGIHVAVAQQQDDRLSNLDRSAHAAAGKRLRRFCQDGGSNLLTKRVEQRRGDEARRDDIHPNGLEFERQRSRERLDAPGRQLK